MVGVSILDRIAACSSLTTILGEELFSCSENHIQLCTDGDNTLQTYGAIRDTCASAIRSSLEGIQMCAPVMIRMTCVPQEWSTKVESGFSR